MQLTGRGFCAASQAHAGIQTLLAAETEAAEVVAAAKLGKVTLLKQAKEEADSEIATYKSQREDQFQVFAKERMGDTGAHSKTTQASTEAELQTIARQARSSLPHHSPAAPQPAAPQLPRCWPSTVSLTCGTPVARR